MCFAVSHSPHGDRVKSVSRAIFDDDERSASDGRISVCICVKYLFQFLDRKKELL